MHAVRVAALAAAGVVALTATGVRIGDHPAYVRVVVDFNSKVPPSQVWFDRLTRTMATVHVNHPGIKTQVSTRTGEGVRVALQPGTQALHIAASFRRHRFKYVSYAVITGNRLAIDLWKSAPPGKNDIRSGRCLSLRRWLDIDFGALRVWGTEHGVFENTFQVVVRAANGTVLGRRTVVHGPSWHTTVKYKVSHWQAGTLEAVAFSPKDGSLACLAQVRVTLAPS